VLRDLGAPSAVASRYRSHPQYLIGPRYYPVLFRVLKIGLAVLAFAVLLAAVAFFAWTVLVLAILERAQPDQAAAPERWDPRDLPPMPAAEEDRVSVPGLTVEIILVLVILAIVNLAPEWVGVLTVTSNRPGFPPLADLGIHLPLLMVNFWLAGAVILKCIVPARRRWTAPTRWIEVAVGVLAAAVVCLIAGRSSLHAPAGIPRLNPAMQVLGRLLYVAPFAVAIQPLLRVIRLLKPARAAGHRRIRHPTQPDGRRIAPNSGAATCANGTFPLRARMPQVPRSEVSRIEPITLAAP
jgi:hypothetical protein